MKILETGGGKSCENAENKEKKLDRKDKESAGKAPRGVSRQNRVIFIKVITITIC